MTMRRRIRIAMMMILIPMTMMAVSPALHPLFEMVLIIMMDDSGLDDVGDDGDDDVVTFAPSALFNL